MMAPGTGVWIQSKILNLVIVITDLRLTEANVCLARKGQFFQNVSQ